MPPGGKAPVEDARRPEGADYGSEAKQLPDGQFLPDDAREVPGHSLCQPVPPFSLIMVCQGSALRAETL
jgi:hypothetical protein